MRNSHEEKRVRYLIVAALISVLWGAVLLASVDRPLDSPLPFDCLPGCLPPMECEPEVLYWGSDGALVYTLCSLSSEWPCRSAYHFRTTYEVHGSLYGCARALSLGDVVAYYGAPDRTQAFSRSAWYWWNDERLRIWTYWRGWINNPRNPITVVSYY